MHVATPTTKITQFIGFSPTFTKLTMQNCKKKQVLGFEFVLPIKTLEFEKANKIFQKLHAFFTCCRKAKLFKRGAAFLPNTVIPDAYRI